MPTPNPKSWLVATIGQLRGPLEWESLLESIRDVHEHYVWSESLPEDEQLPYSVFEQLVELLQQQLARHAPEAVLAALEQLPHSPMVIAPLVQRAREELSASYDERLSQQPNDVEVLPKRAWLRAARRDWDGVIEDTTRLLQHEPWNREAARLRVEARIELEDFAGAYEELDSLLREEPTDVLALRERIRLLLRFHYTDATLADLARLEASPSPAIRLFCAGVYLLLEEFDSVRRLCGEVLAHEPDNDDALFTLGEACWRTRDWPRAQEVLERFLRVSEPEAHLMRQFTRRMQARTFLADTLCERGQLLAGLDQYLYVMGQGTRSYGVVRGYTKATYPVVAGAEHPHVAHAQWVEANMHVELEQGRPWKVIMVRSEAAPYLERLPWTETVQRLEIAEPPEDHRGAYAILFQLQLPALRQLSINAEHFGFPCVRQLVRAPFFTRLHALELTRCGLDLPSLELLVRQAPAGIEELRLVYGDARPRLPIPSRLATIISGSTAFQHLKRLDLTGNHLSTEELRAILYGPFPSLRRLMLTGNDLSGIDTTEVLQAPVLQQLEELVLGDTGIEKQLLPALLERGPPPQLARVHAPADWSDEEAAHLQSHPHRGALELQLGNALRERQWLELFPSI
jgi:tetratricopeptide (TPR) repeat protein